MLLLLLPPMNPPAPLRTCPPPQRQVTQLPPAQQQQQQQQQQIVWTRRAGLGSMRSGEESGMRSGEGRGRAGGRQVRVLWACCGRFSSTMKALAPRAVVKWCSPLARLFAARGCWYLIMFYTCVCCVCVCVCVCVGGKGGDAEGHRGSIY